MSATYKIDTTTITHAESDVFNTVNSLDIKN